MERKSLVGERHCPTEDRGGCPTAGGGGRGEREEEEEEEEESCAVPLGMSVKLAQISKQ